ncbi:hypothetical protein LJK87_13485 [Paenibacillus sp. P25]|nr:hypothetical protein LJK87_13485 [Paenibacillus sp. P25]
MNEKTLIPGEWRFKACDEEEWSPAVVPGRVHTDLLRAGIIPDPFYGTNEKQVQWIDKKDWEYESVFDLSDEQLAENHVNLVFAGLDTYADVSLNGRHLLSADNMFRTWKANVRDIARSGSNTLKVRFRSPIREDLPKLEKLGYPAPAANDQSDVGSSATGRSVCLPARPHIITAGTGDRGS